MNDENVVRDEYGFEVFGEEPKQEPCHIQDKERPTQYDEDGQGLLDFGD